MALIWKIFLYLNFTLSFLLAIRFYKSKYFLYFFTYAAIDPIIILLHYIISFKTHYYMPVAMSLLLLVLPIKDKKHVIVAVISTLIISPLFVLGSIIPVLIASVNACYIVFFLSEEIIEEYRASSAVSVFLIIMVIDTIKDNYKIYLYYQHTNILSEYYTYFLAIGAIVPIIQTFVGPYKKYQFFRNGNVNTIECASINDKSNVDSHILKNKNPFSCLTKREKDVLACLSRGLQPKEISDELFIDKKTVYFHIGNIKEKLNISSTLKLSCYSIENHFYLSQEEYTSHRSDTEK